jgi:Methyltransferase domain
MSLKALLRRAVPERAAPESSGTDTLPDLVPRRPPGTAKASMFFDSFPRFYETSKTSPNRGRLNLRYEAIFEENSDVFADARVLDIASHDGRWSLAALKTGAAEVVGIEAREDLVRAARENLSHYVGDDTRCRFIAGDVFEVLRREAIEVDVVLCLGFLYHTLRYNELMRGIRDANPRYLVVDTRVLSGAAQPRVRLGMEHTDRQSNAAEDPYSYGGRALVGWPSLAALKMMLEAYDFEIDRFSDWGSLIRDNPSVANVPDYARGGRVTARCVSKI